VSALPFFVLPNSLNASDSYAVYSDGTTTTASKAIAELARADALRFMVQGSDLRTPDNPRLTWQETAAGTIVSAAFVSGQDEHGRAVSCAAVFHPDAVADLWRFASLPLSSTQIADLRTFLESRRISILSEIERQRHSGQIGGELDLSKKKLRCAES